MTLRTHGPTTKYVTSRKSAREGPSTLLRDGKAHCHRGQGWFPGFLCSQRGPSIDASRVIHTAPTMCPGSMDWYKGKISLPMG